MRGLKRVHLENIEGALKIEGWEVDRGTTEEVRQILREPKWRIEGILVQ